MAQMHRASRPASDGCRGLGYSAKPANHRRGRVSFPAADKASRCGHPRDVVGPDGRNAEVVRAARSAGIAGTACARSKPNLPGTSWWLVIAGLPETVHGHLRGAHPAQRAVDNERAPDGRRRRLSRTMNFVADTRQLSTLRRARAATAS